MAVLVSLCTEIAMQSLPHLSPSRQITMLSKLRSISTRFSLLLLLPIATFSTGITLPSAIAASQPAPASSGPQNPQAMQLKANVTEANAKTGVVVARGNVQINYPARKIQATAAQAVYFSKEGRIVLSGDVYILQEGNSLRGETVTYLVNEGRFVALPEQNRQVEAIYLVPETANAAPAPAPVPVNPAPVKPAKMPSPTAPKAVPVKPAGESSPKS